MKVFQLLLLSLFLNTVAIAQSATFYPAYIKDAGSAETLIQSNAKRIQTQETVFFLMDYPVLVEISGFKKREKYSLINTQLVKGLPEHKKGKTIFTMINNKKYVVKDKNRKYFSLP